MKKLIQAPYIDQTSKYPTGCESVSAVMLLSCLGISVTVDEFIEKYLDTEPMRLEEGRLCGPNPWKCFAGSPYDSDSFGCYAPVIAKAFDKLFSEKGYPMNIVCCLWDMMMKRTISTTRGTITAASPIRES